MDTNKMRSELRVSAERAIAKNPPGGDGNPHPAIAVRAVDVLALLAEIEQLEAKARLAGVAAEITVHQEVGRAVTREFALTAERDQLKSENGALRDKYEILLEAASNMLRFCDPTCMNDEKWRDRVADMAKEASHD